MMRGKTFRLPEELIEAISRRARRENRTDSQVARLVLEKALAGEIKRKSKAA